MRYPRIQLPTKTESIYRAGFILLLAYNFRLAPDGGSKLGECG